MSEDLKRLSLDYVGGVYELQFLSEDRRHHPQTEKASNTAQFVWEYDSTGEGRLAGKKALLSSNCPSDLDKGTSTGVCSSIIYGNWADLTIGRWSGLDILVDPFTHSASGGIRIRALMDIDVAIRHAKSFSVMKDALTEHLLHIR